MAVALTAGADSVFAPVTTAKEALEMAAAVDFKKARYAGHCAWGVRRRSVPPRKTRLAHLSYCGNFKGSSDASPDCRAYIAHLSWIFGQFSLKA